MVEFSKYHGAGNDFIIIDNRAQSFAPDSARIKHLCDRHKGIGADGLLLLENSEKADFCMRIFNADGSSAAMCGNGIRCLFAFAISLGICKKAAAIETGAGVFSCLSEEQKICVRLPHPTMLGDEVIDSGVPHAVIFVDDLQLIDVAQRGREIRFHARFEPDGVNVTFAELLAEGHGLKISTYERGVEKPTLACGTGAVAAAFLARKKFSLPDLVKVFPPSNEILEVGFHKKEVELKGPASLIFTGRIKT